MNLASVVDRHPTSRRALCGADGWIEWGEVRKRSSALASGLRSLGVRPEDRVALVWPTSIEFVVAYLGALAAGAVVVPLNPASPSAEFARELEFIEPVAVICGGTCTQTIVEIVDTMSNAGSERPHLVTPGGGSGPGSLGAPESETLNWESLISAELASAETADGVSVGAVARSEHDPAVMLFTSGTSGLPRAAVLTHGNLIANLNQMLTVPGELLTEQDVGLAAVPLFHVFGLNVVLGLTLATGAGLVCEERFDPQEALRLVADRGVTVVAGAPPMFADWVQSVEDSKGFSGVRLMVSGASALPPEVAEGFTSKFGQPIWEGYGLTEASPAVATTVGLPYPKPGSVGRPLPGLSVRLVDESNEDVLIDDPGEIWVKGPNVFKGYWRDAEATAQVLDSDGWLHTGDVGVLDDSGDLFIVDRLKDIIIVSGFNVIPAEVERVLQAVAGVKEAVVVGRPDPRTGESVEAVVVKETGADVTSEDIIKASRFHLAHYKVPSTVSFVNELPHGLAGKALRRVARETPSQPG